MWLVGIRPWGLAVLCGALAPAWSPATVEAGPSAVTRPVFADAGARERRLLEAFGLAGDAAHVPGDAAVAGDDPSTGRCGTPLIIDYLAQRDELSPATVSLIDQWLAFDSLGDTLTSAGGHFRLAWVRDGDNAVPLADIDPADGIPDFVAHAAEYLEDAWTVQFEDMGLRTPPGDAPVDVSFRRMHFYGYTVAVDPQAGATRMVLHNSFGRFPPNDDPEGDAAGSMKVTCAHELRHVSQYAGSRWSERGWTELDATWAEERTCSQVNDYHHYLLGDSPVRRPQLSLDHGSTGTGTYDDSVFQIWLNERWGDALIRDYWERRVTASDEDPLASWDTVLEPLGASLAAGWAQFMGWNFATGTRAITGVGYPDAADFPTSEPVAVLALYPSSTAGKVEHLATAPVLLSGFEALGDRLLALDFDGDDTNGSGPMALGLYVQTLDGGGYLETVGLDRHNDARFVLRTPASSLRSVGVLVGNPSRAGEARPWTVAVDTVPGPPKPPAGILAGAQPNPSNPGTWLTCEMSARADVTLEIVDAAGRRVRRLWTGSLGPGSHRFHWDGRSADGRPAPAGVYVARLGLGGGWQARKLTLVR
ncbi:MAG: hypothetical protein IPP62_13950 [bacterium]|jgi:hypothetical protein|nr:hypothetical protein [bacterium]